MLSNGREPLMADAAGRGADAWPGTQFFNLLPASLTARHWVPAAAPQSLPPVPGPLLLGSRLRLYPSLCLRGTRPCRVISS